MTARERVAGNVAGYVDDRTGAAKWMKKNLTKVFPDHWSFLLGEIALYSFIILLLSGTFLTNIKRIEKIPPITNATRCMLIVSLNPYKYVGARLNAKLYFTSPNPKLLLERK